jgi:LacI family transcriptional regulator
MKQIVRQVNPIGVVERASTEVYPLNPPWLSDALVYIHKNVSERLTADDVFKHLGLSHTTVDKTFRKVLNTTVQKEIADSRLKAARYLLANTNLSAAEVAERAGFGSSSYFMRSFTNKHGITPLAWRKANKE